MLQFDHTPWLPAIYCKVRLFKGSRKSSNLFTGISNANLCSLSVSLWFRCNLSTATRCCFSLFFTFSVSLKPTCSFSPLLHHSQGYLWCVWGKWRRVGLERGVRVFVCDRYWLSKWVSVSTWSIWALWACVPQQYLGSSRSFGHFAKFNWLCPWYSLVCIFSYHIINYTEYYNVDFCMQYTVSVCVCVCTAAHLIVCHID